MADSTVNIDEDPEYIQFLLDPDSKFSHYFVVGNSDIAPVEKIGVVRKMLAAHSEVFRSQLLDMKWKCEKPDHINDIFPATFKNLLRYVYGHDTTATMTFDDADDLLYAADRYIMPRLKKKLATRLITLLDYTNLCSLLTNPACARYLELQSEIKKVLQYQTDKVLEHPHFLSCCPDTFVKLLEQEALNVSELQLWIAALKWAKNRVKSESKEQLRQQLEKPLRHLRICSLPLDVFWDEIAPTGILTEEEVVAVGYAHGTGERPPTLTAVSDKMEARRKTVSCSKQSGKWYDESIEQHADVRSEGWVGVCSRELMFTLKTLESPVKISSLVCFVYNPGEYNFTATIQAVGSSDSIAAQSRHETAGYANLHIAVTSCEREVVLSANTKYNITVSCDREYYVYTQRARTDRREHFVLEFSYTDPPLWDFLRRSTNGSPVAHIHYKTLTPR